MCMMSHAIIGVKIAAMQRGHELQEWSLRVLINRL
jgi:hypothetical protein